MIKFNKDIDCEGKQPEGCECFKCWKEAQRIKSEDLTCFSGYGITPKKPIKKYKKEKSPHFPGNHYIK